MKKTILPALALALLLTGCGAPKQTPPEPELPEITEPPTEGENESETEPETEAPKLSFTERVTALKGNTEKAVLLDETGCLSEETAAQYRSALQELADSKEICTALVITDSLAGNTPERFAEKYYMALFGAAEDGFLLLINNDTGKDLYYFAGNITVTDMDMRLAKASKSLAEGDLAPALEILLPAQEDLLILPPEEPEEDYNAQSED